MPNSTSVVTKFPNFRPWFGCGLRDEDPHALTPNVKKIHAIVKARQPYISLNEYMLWQEGPKSLSPKTGRQFSRRAGELSIGAFRRRKGTTQTTAPKHQITHRGKYNEALGKQEKHVKKKQKNKKKNIYPTEPASPDLGAQLAQFLSHFSNPYSIVDESVSGSVARNCATII